MNEKKSAKPLPTDEIQRYNAVLMEEMRGQFKAVTESVTSLGEKMDQGFQWVDGRFNKLEAKVDRIDVRVNKLEESNVRIESRVIKLEESNARIESRVIKLEESNVRIESRVIKLEESNARIESDIRLIKNAIKVKVDLEEFKVLENRVVILEKRLAALAK